MQTTHIQLMANAIRMLSIDAVEKARSGHPGMPMGMAEIAATLWLKHLRHSPKNPQWPARDRFIVSNGHGSMLHYALLHLTGYDVSMDDLKNFRQLHSKTPGHPEYGITSGIETTTGPLGQGLANAVGMALAQKLTALEFDTDKTGLFDHYTYVFVGDGCLMEGISHEVCSLAGVWQLNRLIVLYDDNQISIDGDVKDWYQDDTPARFKAYGWHVIPAVDGHNIEAIDAAITQAKTQDRPTLICCKTVIGQGSPNLAGSDKVHGAPLGAQEVEQVRAALNWNHPPFELPQESQSFINIKGDDQHLEWLNQWNEYQNKYPENAKELTRRAMKSLTDDWVESVKEYLRQVESKKENIATRKANQNSIQAYSKLVPEFLGGSADLTGSNLTNWKEALSIQSPHQNAERKGNYVHYGVREFGMSAIMNGVAIYGNHLPFGGTFLTFSDYARNAIRMAALMKLRSVFVLTHDSICLGEDGPTHQPIEHLASLQLIPNLNVWRPADTLETAIAWQVAIENKEKPTALILSRQNLPYLDYERDLKAMYQGAYVVFTSHEDVPYSLLDLQIVASGSEVQLALETAKHLLEQKPSLKLRVISMPSRDIFLAQTLEYQQQILPKHVPLFAIEAGVPDLWYAFGQKVFGLQTFGESAPMQDLLEYFGLTATQIAPQILAYFTSSSTIKA